MGRHGAGQDDGPQHARDAGTRFGDLGPVTDPFLLDALPVRPRRERDAPPPQDADASTAAGSSRPDRHRAAEASPAPWAPRPVVRRTETPFSGPIALPDIDEPVARPPAGQAPTALHDPAPSAPATAPPRSATAATPADRTSAALPNAAPRSLPALLDEDGAPATTRTIPSGTSAAADDPEEPVEPEAVGLSVRTLLLSLGVGVLVSVALSVVAILPL